MVIGILIAMKVDDWSEEKRRKEEFLVSAEQIYNVLDTEIQALDNIIYHFNLQASLADSLLHYSHLMNERHIPGYLAYLESLPTMSSTSLGFLVQNLRVFPGNKVESLLARNLTDYLVTAQMKFGDNDHLISEQLIQSDIPTPHLLFGVTIEQKVIQKDLNYTDEQVQKARQMIKTPGMQLLLIKLAILKGNNQVQVFHVKQAAEYIRKQLLREYPMIKLLYENVGIIGDGTIHSDWETDIELKLTDETQSIWMSDTLVLDGEVKFRESGTWNRNWGAHTFPKGELIWEAANIDVPKGKYLVKINLFEKTFEFQRVGE